MAQDKVQLTSEALAHILEILKECIKTTDQPEYSPNASRGPWSLFENLRCEAIIRRQIQSQCASTSSQAETDGYGPPVAFDKAFYFHHTHPKFTKMLPAADLSQYNLRSSKRLTASNSTRKAAETILIKTAHNPTQKTMDETSNKPALSISGPKFPKSVISKSHVEKGYRTPVNTMTGNDKNYQTFDDVRSDSDDEISISIGDINADECTIATQKISHAAQGEFFFSSADDQSSQDIGSTHTSQPKHVKCQRTPTQIYLDFIKPIFSRPTEKGNSATYHHSSLQDNPANSSQNASTVPSSALGKRVRDAASPVAEPDRKKVRLSRRKRDSGNS